MREICLPQFGMGMTEGVVTRWHRSAGDPIKEGEPLCEIETAKSTVEMQAPCSGVLAEIVIPVDQSVPVNTCLALVDEGPLAAFNPIMSRCIRPRLRRIRWQGRQCKSSRGRAKRREFTMWN